MMNQDFVFDLKNLNEYRLHLQAGELASPHGQTRVTLYGSGDLEAEQLFGEKEEPEVRKPIRVKGRIENAEDLFRQLAKFDWQSKFPSRPGIPDEAIIIWTVEFQGKVIATLKMWLGEAEKDDRVDAVLKRLRDVIGDLSDNQIYI